MKHSIPRFDNYTLSPFELNTKVVNDGSKVKKPKENMFPLYFSKLKKFSFYIFDAKLKIDEILKNCNNELANELKHDKSENRPLDLQIEELSYYRVTDNSNHILSCTYVFSRYPSYHSGQLIFLPPLTEHPVEDMVDAILDGLQLTSRRETPISWISNVPIPGISILEMKKQKFQRIRSLPLEDRRLNLQKEIEGLEPAKTDANSQLMDLKTKYPK